MTTSAVEKVMASTPFALRCGGGCCGRGLGGWSWSGLSRSGSNGRG
eukprot:CAMPEP_0206595916 /NCGR_PEP_ID=MMETSP0325_2-20121206/43259_1 /ASSEMBLY_ACC=CAM_ASM_000347 /TAXON_ID=2866 /ORGANISM="Crypthecodinium cohnii, Strain Seligo" /LENGTH=45 /DNA_ID= /DNA_START= /DNA_END= /DNA_ORIENTATION=